MTEPALADHHELLLAELSRLEEPAIVSQVELALTFYDYARREADWEVAVRGAHRARDMLGLAQDELSKMNLTGSHQERLTRHCRALRADIDRATTLLNVRLLRSNAG